MLNLYLKIYTLINQSSLIDTNNKMFTIKELLNKLDCPINEVYIEKKKEYIDNHILFIFF